MKRLVHNVGHRKHPDEIPHTDQGEGADEDHGNDGGLEVLVLDEAEGLDPEVGPALPERRFLVSHHTREVNVAPYQYLNSIIIILCWYSISV